MANRETVETVADFILWGSKITADGDCSHEIKRLLLPGGKKIYEKPRQHIEKQRHHIAKKHSFSQSCGFFSVVMYGCESWTIKKDEHRIIDAFKLWCWRRLLRVPWTATRFNKSILKEISPEYSLEGLMLKLSLQYFGYLMQKSDSLEKTLILGKIEGRRIRGQQRLRWLDGITNDGHEFQQALEVGDQWGSLVYCHPGGPKESEMTEWLNLTE